MGRVILTRLLVAEGVECVNGMSDLDEMLVAGGVECVNGTSDLDETACSWGS